MTIDFKPADIILVCGDGPISRAIEMVEGSQYSHTAGWVKPGELIEANGFRRTGYQALDYYDGRADVFRCETLTDEQKAKIVEYAKWNVGMKYSYVLLFVELIRYWFGIWLPFNQGVNRICSTLWADAYRAAGIDLCPGIKYPSPADLRNSKLLRKIGSY